MTGAVLAGGRSTRMGTNKALLEFGGVRIIERLLETLRPLFAEVAIVANDPGVYGYLGVPIWPDRVPGAGALGGLYTAVRNSSHSQTFCIACDMPCPSSRLIAYLQRLAPGHDAVVPRTADGYQPLHAVYGKSCVPAMESLLAARRLKIDQLFPLVRVRIVEEPELRPIDPLLHAFLNVNTREELEAAAQIARHAA
jgi:molybdopterin-guanine dinucleotide biosynthesis protein A